MTRIEVKNKKTFMQAVDLALKNEGFQGKALASWLADVRDALDQGNKIYTTPFKSHRIVLQ